MMINVKVNKELFEKQWYIMPIVKSVFIHSLLKAKSEDVTHEDKYIFVEKGSFVSTYEIMTYELGLSKFQLWKALRYLVKCKEIEIIKERPWMTIKVLDYEKYI